MGIRAKQLVGKTQNLPEKNASFWKKEIHFGNTFNAKKKEQFYSELHVLLVSGIRLKDALLLMAETQKNKNDKNRIQFFIDDILVGKDFSWTIAKDKNFTNYEIQSIRIGEHIGSLDVITKSLCEFYSQKNELRRNVKSAISYPIIVLVTAILAVVFMLRFVVPMFQDIFNQNNIELPTLTQTIINISKAMDGMIPLLLLLFFGVLIGKRIYYKKPWYRKYKAFVLQRIPLIGPFLKINYLAKFCQALSLLVNSKVSILNAIKLSKEMIAFYPLEKALSVVEQDLMKGDQLSDSLAKHKIFDHKMIALLKVAERTNQTEFIFQKLQQQYTEEVLYKSKQFSTILEPIIILLVGLIVGIILIAMYLPMFELGNVLG